jgi:CCR4-NOT transcription complex subunit 6
MDDWKSVDGCATFYRSSRFELATEVKVEYQSIAIGKHKAFATDQVALQRLLGRDNIALLLVRRHNSFVYAVSFTRVCLI